MPNNDIPADEVGDSSATPQPGKSISHRAIRSGYWILGLRVSEQALHTLKLLVLANILPPEQFGVMGVALLVIGIVSTATDTGMEQALIQRKDDIRPYLNSAWTLLVARGALIFGILWVVAPLAAKFFDVPETTAILRVAGAALFIQGFQNVNVIRYKKQLDFRKQVVYEMSGVAVDVVVSIAASIILKNVWGLVIGRVAGSISRTIASYVIDPYRPRFDFNRGKANTLLHFGKWVLGSSVLVFLITQGDDFLVGRILGATALGFYQMAYRIACLPATEVTSMISQVTYPAYALIQDDKARLRSGYERVLILTALLSFLLGGIVFAVGRESVVLFMGAKWLPMVLSMQLLVWWGIIRGLNSSQSPIFMAVGKPKIVTRQQSVQAILMYAIIFPLMSRYGIVGASIAVLAPAVVLFFWRNQVLIRILEWREWAFYRLLVFPGVITAASVFATWGMREALGGTITFLNWAVLVATFGVTFAALTLLLDKLFKLHVITLAKQAFPKQAG